MWRQEKYTRLAPSLPPVLVEEWSDDDDDEDDADDDDKGDERKEEEEKEEESLLIGLFWNKQAHLATIASQLHLKIIW